MPKIEVSDTVKDDIKNAVNANQEVLIPEEEVSFYDWKGTGYIVSDPETEASGYMISGGLAGGSSAGDFSNVDPFKVILSFLKGFAEGIFMGVLFSIINIGIMTIFTPAIAQLVITAIAVAFFVRFVFDLIDNIRYLASGEMSPEEWVYYCAETAGAFIGGIFSGKYTNDFFNKKVNEYVKATNEKYEIPDDVSAKIRENTSLKHYGKVAEQVSRLKKSGISDEGIKDILSDVPSEKISEVTDVVEKWNSSHPDGNLTDSQLGEICRGVQDGKSTDDILNGVNESGKDSFKFCDMTESEIARIVEEYRKKAPIEIPDAAKYKAKSMAAGINTIFDRRK